MSILALSDPLLQRLTVTDGRIVRDKVLCGFCVRLNKRSRTFLVATSVQGKQLRMMLGRWPLISVEEARSMAVVVLRECRAGRSPELPAWRAALDKIGEKQRDYLLLLLYTGLRRDEGHNLTPADIDFDLGVLSIADTKNGKPHSLPITPMMDDILRRRCEELTDADKLFKGVSKEHVYSMAIRQGAPRFMLHDLRKLLATTGERLKVGDAVLRRILNHTAPKSDVLHKHYVSLGLTDIAGPLFGIQHELDNMMNNRGYLNQSVRQTG